VARSRLGAPLLGRRHRRADVRRGAFRLKLDERIHLVGSGSFGFDLTDPYDCHVYLLDGGSELALVDVGAGMGAAQIVVNIERCGFDRAQVKQLICTHAHGDHAGGAARMRELLPNASLLLSKHGAEVIRAGDERAASLDVAKQAGIYPADYRLEPCAVERELAEADTVTVGDLVLECIETPGHSSGHLSFLLEHDGRRSLFGGDVVFHGGAVLLQNIHDCSVVELARSLRKLRSLAVDALYPGHLAFSRTGGQRHIERANAILDTLLVPPQAVPAW
jgi:glyoxylase-like metal-dependent hydrolase (beta-lactamase superfamily II)